MMNTTQFCRLAHTSRDTLRFYDQSQLLTPKRTQNNYRDYTMDDLTTFQIIQNLKTAGLSLAEIAQVLALQTQPITPTCQANVIALMAQKLADFQLHAKFYQHLIITTEQMIDEVTNQRQENLRPLIIALGQLEP